MQPAIQAIQLGKCYQRRGVGAPTLISRLTRGGSASLYEPFWALRDINFSIPRGTTVGVVGPNGSGKSSLLGLAAGTIYPTEGRIETHGRISSLLELGAGFHPDLSGRENVFLNAAVLGIPREDIAKRMDHIIDFANLSDFIDMPVKHYSSGMYVRLGFAVAVEMDPDILLVDEVLAVGDIAFQMRCFDRIKNFQKRGKTILLVTHDLVSVEQFCSEVKLIHQGKLVAEGDPSDVVLTYLKSYMARIGQLNVEEHGTRDIEITGVRMFDETGKETGTLHTGTLMDVEISYRARKRIEDPVFGYSIKTGNGFYIFGTNTQIMKVAVPSVEGEGVMRLRIEPLTLMEGKYFLSLAIHDQTHAVQYHRQEDWYPFAVKNTASDHHGVFQLPTTWTHVTGSV
ncbi:MAG TPA: ABC transporter ATP-binding protein [Kiritimatiellia bacterium]|nr:ABC transporter ATP-binding protein [Kiritimatiellia bacterium]